MVDEDITIIIPSNRPVLANETKNCFKNYNCIIHDGNNYTSFSKLINDCVIECPTEIVIIGNDKVRGNNSHIEKIVTLINEGYGIVALYAFGFFGFKKDLIRKIGFFDERYLGGGFEDRDMIIRLNEANIAYYETREVPYHNISSSWNYSRIDSLAEKHYNNKWKNIMVVNPEAPQTANMGGVRRILDEEKYNYDISNYIGTEFLSANDVKAIGKGNHFWSKIRVFK